MARQTFDIFLSTSQLDQTGLEAPDDDVVDTTNVPMTPHHQHLYQFLRETGCIHGLDGSTLDFTRILSTDVVSLMRKGDHAWKQYVPAKAREIIESKQLYGLTSNGNSD